MALTTLDGLLSALANPAKRQEIQMSKGAVSGISAGTQASFWLRGTYPALAVAPTAPAACDNSLLGAFPISNPGAGDTLYLAKAFLNATASMGFELHDRLAHMGGLSGTSTSAQTVGLDLNALSGTANIAARLVKNDYSRVQWWLEWYTTTGGTSVNATVSYTDQNGTSGKTVVVALTGQKFTNFLIPIMPNAGDNIRSIESVTLSASTGTAGNFGVTATVLRSSLACTIATLSFMYDWSQTGLPVIYNSSCLMIIGDSATTAAVTFGGSLTFVSG